MEIKDEGRNREDLGEDTGSLFSAHNRNPGIGPHVHEARRVSAAAHSVVAGSEGSSYDERKLWHLDIFVGEI